MVFLTRRAFLPEYFDSMVLYAISIVDGERSGTVDESVEPRRDIFCRGEMDL